MYSITYGDDLLYDPLDGDAYPVSDVSLSAEINGSGSCEFSITKTHPLYDVIDLYDTDRLVTVTEDSHILFKGYVASVDEDEYGVRTYSCTGILSFLKKSVVRPYSTDAEDEKHVKAPSTIDGFFNWLISEHDNHTDRRKQFIVGRNEGDIVRRENVIHASSDSASTTANVLQSELLDGLGGYVFVRYGDDGVTYLDYLSECRDTNAQVIDFGVNLVSYSRTDDATDVATVCYAKGGTPEKDEGSDKEKPPIDLTKYPDGPFARGSYRFEKSGDRIICLDLVDKYGYSEMTFEDSDLLDPYELLDSAAIALLKQLEPKVTIDIRAIDLSLFMDGYQPLRCGELVRVRSDPNGFDSYMLVSGMDLDLESPENTEYTLGTTFDAFTGESNKIIRQLNATINKSVDQVTALDQTTKDQAIEIGKAQEAADNAQQSADNAQQSADQAQTSADNAQQTANTAQNTANTAQETANANKEAIDTVKDKQSEQDKLIEKLQQGITDSEADISGINDRLTQMDSDIEQAQSDIDAVRQEAQTNFETAKAKADAVGADLESFRTETGESIQNVKDSVSSVQSDVDAVEQKAADLASDLDGTKATVERVTTDLGEVKTTVSNAATKADQALQVSTSASQTATEARTTATSAYQDAQSALTQSSVASQTANAVKTELETKYSTTDEIAEQYATKSLVEQTSQSITSTVEATYATKATVEALENIANNAVQTWMGSGVPTLSNKPASDWTTAELKSQHSGDIYYDSDTGYSYRFGSSDGKNYSWSLIKDTDISKAVADAAKAQQTAEGVSDEVTQLKTDIPATYATKTEVKQTTDSIKSSVSEVATTANSALSKATTVEQTANGLQTTVTEQASKIDQNTTTISQVSQKADSLSSTITQVSKDVQSTNSAVLIQNPGFETGDLTGWTADNWLNPRAEKFDKNMKGIGEYRFNGYAQQGTSIYSYLRSKAIFGAIPGKTYKVSVSALYADSNTTAFMMLRRVSDNARPQITKAIGPSWTSFSGELTVPSNWSIGDNVRFEFAVQGIASGTNRILADDFSIVDVSDAKTANNTANSALSQSSRVEQSLDSFKTSVSRDYQTKTDALSQKSELEQNINSFKTTVSETYTTKETFNTISRDDNLWPNQYFESGKPMIPSKNTPVEDVTPPGGGSAIYLGGRDHFNLNTAFPVTPGHIYRITVDAFLVRGSIVLKAGIWWTKYTSGTAFDMYRSPIASSDLSDGWKHYVYEITALSRKQAGAVFFQLEQSSSGGSTAYYISNLVVQDVTVEKALESDVSAASQNASSALSKVSSLEVSVDGIDTRVEEVASNADEAVKTASQVSQRVDSLSSTITQVQGDIDAINTSVELINPDFETGDITGWVVDKSQGGDPAYVNNVNPNSGTYKLVIPSMPKDGNLSIVNDATFSVKEGDKYRVSVALHPDGTISGPGNVNIGFHYSDGSNNGFTKDIIGAEWHSYSDIVTIPSGKKTAQFRIGLNVASGNPVRVDSVKIENVTDAMAATSTANSALSKSSSVEQNLNSFKTSVSQTYETKSDALNKQSSLQQSVNNLRTEVSETYTTKTEFENLQIGGTNLFVMGTSKDGFRVSADGGEFSDSGYTISDYISVQPNEKYILTAYMDGSENTSDDYVSIARYRSDKSFINRPIMDTNSFKYGDSWVITTTSETAYVRLSFPTSGKDKFKFEQGSKSTDWSPAPEDMLSKDEAETTYSTKSYVDQTSRTVSLGVVEEYKKGQHGSALATQSDITAAKDSITSTVSQTYATKNDVGVGNLIKNGDFSDGMTNWTAGGGSASVSDGTYGKQLVFTQNSINSTGGRIYNASYNHINGQAYEVSFYAKADKSSKWHFGPNSSSKAASFTLDTALKQYTMQYQADSTFVPSIWTDNPTATIHLERVKLSVASGYYATKTEVKQTSDSLTVTISSAVSKAESAATAASKAQNTANTANTTANAAKSAASDAQSRVGAVETLIRMDSNGVRVGKSTNGQYTQPSALVSSDGTFQMLASSGEVLVEFGAKNQGVPYITSGSDDGSLWVGAAPNTSGSAIKPHLAFNNGVLDVNANSVVIGQGSNLSAEFPMTRWSRTLTQENPVSSQVFPNCKVEGWAVGPIVMLHIKQSGDMGTNSNSPGRIATLAPQCRPPFTVKHMFGVQNGSWLWVKVTTDGNVYVGHDFGATSLAWLGPETTFCFARKFSN